MHVALKHSSDDWRASTVSALVIAGDRDWALVPRPCLELEGALVCVWRAAPGELPRLMEAHSRRAGARAHRAASAAPAHPAASPPGDAGAGARV